MLLIAVNYQKALKDLEYSTLVVNYGAFFDSFGTFFGHFHFWVKYF